MPYGRGVNITKEEYTRLRNAKNPRDYVYTASDVLWGDKVMAKSVLKLSAKSSKKGLDQTKLSALKNAYHNFLKKKCLRADVQPQSKRFKEYLSAALTNATKRQRTQLKAKKSVPIFIKKLEMRNKKKKVVRPITDSESGLEG